MDEIIKYNHQLDEKYNSRQTDNNKINNIIKPILHANLSPLSNINMNTNIKSIKVSFHNKTDSEWTFGLNINRD